MFKILLIVFGGMFLTVGVLNHLYPMGDTAFVAVFLSGNFITAYFTIQAIEEYRRR